MKSTETEAPDHPNLPIKPPELFALAIALGLGVHLFWPCAARPAGWMAAGLVVVLLGAALILWAVWEFRRHKTAVRPWKATRVIVEGGPYAFSRNPIYISFALIQVGIGLWSNQLAVVLMVIPAIIATRVLVIAREERYLARKFGEPYREYMTRVRRWL